MIKYHSGCEVGKQPVGTCKLQRRELFFTNYSKKLKSFMLHLCQMICPRGISAIFMSVNGSALSMEMAIATSWFSFAKWATYTHATTTKLQINWEISIHNITLNNSENIVHYYSHVSIGWLAEQQITHISNWRVIIPAVTPKALPIPSMFFHQHFWHGAHILYRHKCKTATCNLDGVVLRRCTKSILGDFVV